MSKMTQNEVEDLILSVTSWEGWGYRYNNHPDIKVVESELDEGGEESWDGAHHDQGHEGVCFLVFEVDGRYWRKTGTTDSYASRTWDGKFREVSKGEVIVTRYEWKDV